ncbi:MAG: diaminopimelate epimerase [Acidobacteria bacterium]|nr:diaminopimelate epimerase [Acidobacteriota bacterium]
MKIPFTKTHGAKNDFLLTWAYEAPRSGLTEIARAICHRNTGVGADGWMLVTPAAKGQTAYDAAIRLFNADGSEPELSGNGTRCAAAFLIDSGAAPAGDIRLLTGAGVKHLRLVDSSGLLYQFEMNMGAARLDGDAVSFPLPLAGGLAEVTAVNVGNPQCAVFVDSFPANWEATGAEIEGHSRFPQRSNVSFVHVIDRHTLDVRFYERGVGVTLSSGTGSTGAVAAAMFRGLVDSPVRVLTPAGPLELRMDENYYLTGPAEITAGGEYYYERS